MSENRYLESYTEIIKSAKNLTKEEEQKLFANVHSSNPFVAKKARDSIVNNSLKLIIPLAQKYKTEKINVEELFSVGLKGLIKSVNSFEPTKGFRFSTYAVPNILQAITIYINQYNRFVRLPVNILADLRIITREKNKLLYRSGKEPSNHELAEEFKKLKINIDEEKLNYYDSMIKNVYWLGEEQQKDDEQKSEEEINDESEFTSLSSFDNAKKIIREILTNEQYEMFCMKYGLDNKTKMIVEDIAKYFKITKDVARGRIKKIEEIIRTNPKLEEIKKSIN